MADGVFKAAFDTDLPIGATTFFIQELGRDASPESPETPDLKSSKSQPADHDSDNLPAPVQQQEEATAQAEMPVPATPSEAQDVQPHAADRIMPWSEQDNINDVIAGPNQDGTGHESASPANSPNESDRHNSSDNPARSVEEDGDALFHAAAGAGESSQELPDLDGPGETHGADMATNASEVTTDIEPQNQDAHVDHDSHRARKRRHESEESTIIINSKQDTAKKTLEPVDVSPVQKKRKLARDRKEGSGIPRKSERTTQAVPGTEIKVFFASNTTVNSTRSNLDQLGRLGIIKIEDAADCDVYCVKHKTRFNRSANFIKAILLGKPVVSDDWLWTSIRVGKRHNHIDYLAKDQLRERAWGFRVTDAVERGQNRVQALKGCRVVFTNGLVKSLGDAYDDLQEVALVAGATSVDVLKGGNPSGASERNVLVLGDEDEACTQDLIKNGWSCYNKEMVRRPPLFYQPSLC